MILRNIVETAAEGVALAAGAGLCYQWASQWRDGVRFPAPGRMIAVPGGALHCVERGIGSPTVVLEAGISGSSVSWRPVQKELARRTRVLAYDRAGYGWSGPASAPRTMDRLCDELAAMLEASGARGPYVLVGHSFGGLLLRHFAARRPDLVAGLVLVDPLEPFEWWPLTEIQAYRLSKGVKLSRRGAWLARFGVVRLGLDLLTAGSRTLPKLLAKASSGKGSVVTDRLVGEVRKLPRELWPILKSQWSRPRGFKTMAEYLERLPANCSIEPDPKALSNVALVVISAERTSPQVIEAHRRTAALSARGRHIVAENSGHWVQLDRPDIVVNAVLDVTAQAAKLD